MACNTHGDSVQSLILYELIVSEKISLSLCSEILRGIFQFYDFCDVYCVEWINKLHKKYRFVLLIKELRKKIKSYWWNSKHQSYN